MTHSKPCPLLCLALALSALLAPGCKKGPGRQPAEGAEGAAEEFLESWSKGESPDQFAGGHPRVSATDPDWKAGYRLLSYLGVESRQSRQEPPRFRCRFALSLRDRKGKLVEKEVVYEIVPGEKYVINRARR